jgi:hypothetical protein
MSRVTKASLVQECEHLRRMLCLEIQTNKQLNAEIAALKAAQVSSFRNSAPRNARNVISEIAVAAQRYCEKHNVKSVSREQLLQELNA